ncbi:uncharacterized protein LOC133847555 [Drosophila sulfurigaster albostrigata]|uniref:uncharacterized protein LOC133847555 n=1 Tax=Drosophila sulfurigaster albostrigata TaxID=89887 RepID=UPI002D219D28|nr:uncharacterized protein LOC133847555 [Drosophila sulfurigaster albostrigata]
MTTPLNVINSHSPLIEITPNNWEILLDIYSSKRIEPNGYNLIKNFIKWIEKNPELDIKCYSLDEDWKTDGTFIMIVNHGTAQKFIYFNTLSENLDRLIKLLFGYTTNAKAYYFLYGYGERLKPTIDENMQIFGHTQLDTLQTIWYRANKEVVTTFSIEPPSGISLRTLETADAEIVNELWPHRAERTIEFVKHLIDHNISIGACDSNGKLIAWCLRLPLGSLGMLHVVASQRRLGLGSLMVRCLSKKIAEHNDEVLASVVPENMPSREMFEKLGFRQIDNVYWTSGSATK